MKSVLFSLITLVFFSGCSATWNGIKEDTSNSLYWTQEQINYGASYIKEKTE